MNGLPRPWDPFIKGICSQSKLTKFTRLWEDCMQEEARLEAREEKLGQEENQALPVQARKGKNKVEDRLQSKFQKHQKKKKRSIQIFDASLVRKMVTSQGTVRW